jgi:uncharacterized membrane protein (DUF373 family)
LGLKLYSWFERLIVIVLLLLLMTMVGWGTFILASEMGGRLWANLSGAPRPPIEDLHTFIERFRMLHEVFGTFLLILIGLELMKTVVAYLEDHSLHVEIVFTVAMIAVARHTIDLDLSKVQPLTLIGMAALVVGLALGQYWYRKSAAPEARRSQG